MAYKLPHKNNIEQPKKPVWTEVILVFYIDIGNMELRDVPEYIEKVKTQLYYDKPKGSAPWFYVPVKNSESRVECINPITINDPGLVNQMLNELQQINQSLSTTLLMIDKPEKFYINKKEI